MIEYDPGRWSLHLILKCKGSVFPTAFVFATPCALVAGIAHVILHKNTDLLDSMGISQSATSLFGGFTFVLGFLVVFRAQLAYNRWWEGGTLLCQLRGEWFSSYSSLHAFCNADPEKRAEVEKFRHTLARLYSLLYTCALAYVSPNKDEVGQISLNTFQLINLDGFDPDSLRFLSNCTNLVEVVLQWIQRLVVESNEKEILKISPPILSRVFNSLGNGFVCLDGAKKIKDFPFPFPMAQIAMGMLAVQSVFTPFICAATVETPLWAALITFVVSFCYWSVSYIALELEMPYGDDANDLPLYDMAIDMNASLRQLLEPQAILVPPFTYIPSSGLRSWDVDLDTDLSITARSQSLLSAEEQEELSKQNANKTLRVCSSNIRSDTTSKYPDVRAPAQISPSQTEEQEVVPSRKLGRSLSADPTAIDARNVDDSPVRAHSSPLMAAPSVPDVLPERRSRSFSSPSAPSALQNQRTHDSNGLSVEAQENTRIIHGSGTSTNENTPTASFLQTPLAKPKSSHGNKVVNRHEIAPPEYVHPQEPSTAPLAMPEIQSTELV